MEDMNFCQSCAMPLTKNEDFGTEKDGSLNQDYCNYCYADGKFRQQVTKEQMIEACVPFVSKGNPYHSEEEASKAMNEIFPQLKRWK